MKALRSSFLALLALGLALVVPQRSYAVSKEIIQLQTQVQALQDAVARLQQSNDEGVGKMQTLIQQTTDSVNRMTQTMDAVQRQMRTQSDASGKNVEQVSGQMQSLNDSVDELKARLGRIEKSLADLQSTQQSLSARLDSGTTPAPASSTSNPSVPAATAPATSTPTRGSRGALTPPSVPAAPASAAPSADDLYQTALSDFNGAKYALAASEFSDVTKLYPDSNLAGNAYFYLGEIDYKAGRYAPASKNYDKVLEQYPGNAKTPTAQLRKGEALLALKQSEAGVRELRSLIQRYPNSQEASTARSKLSGMGVTVTPRTHTAER